MLGHTTANGVFVPQPTSNGMATALSSPSKLGIFQEYSAPTTELDAAIAELEARLMSLKKYEDEFISLNLAETRRLLAEELADVENQIRRKKKEKGRLLMERLKRRVWWACSQRE